MLLYSPNCCGKIEMPRHATTEVQRTPFALWLSRTRKARGFTQDDLCEVSGVDQGIISKYERGILEPPKRDVVQRLAAALSGPDADEHVSGHLLNEGLKTAGFATTEDDFAPEHEVIDFLRGQPDPKKDRALRILQAAFADEDAADNAGNIGKSAE